MKIFYLNLVVSIMLMFSVIARIPDVIKACRSVKISKGDFSAEIESE